MNGKTATVRNYTNQPVALVQINNSGTAPFAWEIENWNITLPYSLLSGDMLNMKVKVILPISGKTELLCDTLFVNTATSDNHVMICIDPLLLSQTNPLENTSNVTVYPNPINCDATFRLNNNKDTFVRIEVFSMFGELVSVPCNKMFEQGMSTIAWDASGFNGQKLAPGIYLYRISQDNKLYSGKITVLR